MISIFPPWQDSLTIVSFIVLIILIFSLFHWFLSAHYFREHHIGEKFYVVGITKRKIKTTPTSIQELIYEGTPMDVGSTEYFIPEGNKGKPLDLHTWYELVREDNVYTLVKANM